MSDLSPLERSRAVAHDLGVIESYLQHLKGAAASMVFAPTQLARMRSLPDLPGHGDAQWAITPELTAKVAEDLRQACLLVEQAHQQLTPVFFRHHPGFKLEDGYRYKAPNL